MQSYHKLLAMLALILPAQISLAGKDVEQSTAPFKYSPALETSAMKYGKRLVGEIDLMLPIWQNQNNLNIFDIKYKKDRKSFEYNIGLVYRHNFNDKWIWGFYNYFDYRKTESGLKVSQWTVGTEILSEFFDSRFNLYIPQNKKQVIYTKPHELKRDHTAIYALSAGKYQEHTLPGYDVEIGFPLFALGTVNKGIDDQGLGGLK